MSDKMIQEVKALKSSGLKILVSGTNVKENLQKAVCGSNTKYATGGGR